MRLLKRRLVEIVFFALIISFFGFLSICLWLLSTIGSPAANYIGFSIILFSGGLILLIPFFKPRGHLGRFKIWSIKNNVLFKADWIWAPTAAAVGASAIGILIASRSTIVFFIATQGMLAVQPGLSIDTIRTYYAFSFPSTYHIQTALMLQQDYPCGLVQQTCHLCLAPVTNDTAPFLFWTACVVTEDGCVNSLASAYPDSCLGSWRNFTPSEAIASGQNIQGLAAIKSTFGYDAILVQQNDVTTQYNDGLLELVLSLSLFGGLLTLAALVRRPIGNCCHCHPPLPLPPAPKPQINAGRRR